MRIRLCSVSHYFGYVAVKSIAATEANRQFSRILREVRAGETYTITSRGEPVATLAPAGSDKARREALKRHLIELREQPCLNLGKFDRDEAYDA
jgi:prevent-host-death family protein